MMQKGARIILVYEGIVLRLWIPLLQSPIYIYFGDTPTKYITSHEIIRYDSNNNICYNNMIAKVVWGRFCHCMALID